MTTPAEIIARYDMMPIPHEGGWFAAGPRTQDLSNILVLLTSDPEGFSAMHRLDIDEGWTWLDGDPVALLRLRRGGRGVLNLLDRRNRSILVRNGDWQGAATLGSWSLISCWCSPAFRERHFHLGDRDELTGAYPEFATEIATLTRRKGSEPCVPRGSRA